MGIVAEKAGGKPYEQLVRELIFTPLQMTHSGFDFIHLQDTLKATGYKTINADKQIPVHLIDSTVSYATGEIYSTTGDLYKWAKSIAAKRILSADSWKKSFTPFNTGHESYQGKYGYGWFIDSMNGKNCVWHSGGITGFTSFFVYFPEEEVFIILVNNFLYEGDERDNQPVLPAQDLSAIIFNKPYRLYQEREEVKISDGVSDKYVGTYALSIKPKRKMIITKQDGNLSAMLPGVTTMKLIFSTTTKFQFQGVANAEGEFIVADEKVKIVISQNGQFVWEKIK